MSMKIQTVALAAFVLLVTFGATTVSSQAPDKGGKKKKSDKTWVASSIPKLPTGVTHHTLRSEAMKRDVGYCIYLPPGYAQDVERRYPVLYELHGAGGDETRMLVCAEHLHEAILTGRVPETIMVLPNGGRGTGYQDSGDGRSLPETMIIKELIPHIAATYRTVADRKARCLEGFSMGARGATHLAMRYPEMFCSLFNQAGNVYHVSDPSQLPNEYLGSDPERLKANDPYLNLIKNRDYIRANLRIQVACGSADTEHIKTVREYHAALTAAEVPHSYFEVEGVAHNKKKLYESRKNTWFDCHVESLKLNGVELHYVKGAP
jgi:enterochelin esterase-like enzyme